jgi:polyisoprenoid-binding protein YceI
MTPDIMRTSVKVPLTVIAFATLATLAVPVCAQQKLVAAQSEIVFVSRQLGVPVEGRFRKLDARVDFDPRKPEAARIGMTIDLGSVALGIAETEAELAKPDWFAVHQFPQASFQSTGVKPAGPGKFDVAGKLSIKGASRDVVVPVALAQSGANTTASGAFVIRRLDFRIGDGDWKDTSMVANDVQVRFKLTLTGVPAL